MRQEYHIEGQTTNDINEWFSGNLESYEHSLLDYKDKTLDQQNQLLSKCVNKKWLAVEDLIKLLEVSIIDVEEAQGNEFDRGYATALSVFKDWIVDKVLSSDSEPEGSTHNKDPDIIRNFRFSPISEVQHKNGRN